MKDTTMSPAIEVLETEIETANGWLVDNRPISEAEEETWEYYKNCLEAAIAKLKVVEE